MAGTATAPTVPDRQDDSQSALDGLAKQIADLQNAANRCLTRDEGQADLSYDVESKGNLSSGVIRWDDEREFIDLDFRKGDLKDQLITELMRIGRLYTDIADRLKREWQGDRDNVPLYVLHQTNADGVKELLEVTAGDGAFSASAVAFMRGKTAGLATKRVRTSISSPRRCIVAALRTCAAWMEWEETVADGATDMYFFPEHNMDIHTGLMDAEEISVASAIYATESLDAAWKLAAEINEAQMRDDLDERIGILSWAVVLEVGDWVEIGRASITIAEGGVGVAQDVGVEKREHYRAVRLVKPTEEEIEKFKTVTATYTPEATATTWNIEIEEIDAETEAA